MSPHKPNSKTMQHFEMRLAALEELDLETVIPKLKHEIESRVSLEESKKI